MSPLEGRYGYFQNGLLKIIEQKNYGCLSVFLDKELNKKGFEFTREKFMDLLDDFGLLIDETVPLPERFIVGVAYGSVAGFNKWIFSIFNKKFTMRSDKSAHFDKSFYLIASESTHKFIPIQYNVIYEKFLLNLYEKKRIKKTFLKFNLVLESSDFVLYKDYKNGRKIAIEVDADMRKSFDGRVEVKMMYARNPKAIEYRIKLGERRYKYSLTFNEDGSFQGEGGVWKHKKSPSKTSKKKKSAAENELFDKVIEMIESACGRKMLANQHANISLGRVGGIQVLVNLPVKKFANTEIDFKLINKEELQILKGGAIIKVLYLTRTPKSNWLVGKK